jgi:membrane protein implicated in regulation of membrane protease activity
MGKSWSLLQAAATPLEGWLETALTLDGLVTHWQFWLWLTLVLLIVEILTTGFFIGAFAPASLAAAGAAALGLSVNAQLVVFSAVALVAVIWLRPIVVKHMTPTTLPTNTDALVGQTGTVVDTVPAGGNGRVRLSNEEWRATSDGHLAVGDIVRVLEVSGNTLKVGKA